MMIIMTAYDINFDYDNDGDLHFVVIVDGAVLVAVVITI